MIEQIAHYIAVGFFLLVGICGCIYGLMPYEKYEDDEPEDGRYNWYGYAEKDEDEHKS